MRPSEIKASQFSDYPPQARQVAVSHIDLLRRLPLAFVPLLLQQIEQYDWKFPAERREIDHLLAYLSSNSNPEVSQQLSAFARVKLSSHIKHMNWVKSPTRFSEVLSAYLWSSGQINSFRLASNRFMEKVHATAPIEPLPVPRLGIAVIGKGVTENKYPLFRKLRPHGTHFSKVDPSNGLSTLLKATMDRASANPIPYQHWYIDGGSAATSPNDSLNLISYKTLQPVRTALLHKMTKVIQGGIGGPEALTTMLHKIRPKEIGLSEKPQDEVLSHFVTNVLTFGAGTQIFSTTFVQWTARELWRRAQPLTVLAHFTPRQRQRPMNELLSGKDASPQPDPMGSLIDADMGAYLMWIDQQRLMGAKQASFLVWFEDHNQAMVVSPEMPANTSSDSPVNMDWILRQIGVKAAEDLKTSRSQSKQTADLRPTQGDSVLDLIDTNEDMVDFLNGADYNPLAKQV